MKAPLPGEIRIMPDSYHLLNSGGATFSIDADTRREIEAWMKSAGPDDQLCIDTIFGEEVTLFPNHIHVIWSTTPDSRAWERSMNQQLAAEDPLAT